jgi:hypothetical protein
MPTVSSFISSNNYTRESITGNFVAAMRVGTGYVAPSFTNGGASTDPGGMFGWLIYARSNTAYYNPAKGTTADKYILYSNPSDLVGDLNKLSGVTNCLLGTSTGSTFSFFVSTDSSTVTEKQNGTDFLYAINYLAYGGQLLLAPFTTGFGTYQSNTGTYIDVVIDKDIDQNVARWLETQNYTIGIYPTIPVTGGVTGEGFTLPAFDTLFATTANVSGNPGKRIFGVYGTKSRSTANNDLDISTLLSNGSFSYTLNTTADIAGFFARAKGRNEEYLTVAGLDRSIPLNGSINNTVDWSSTTKNNLRNNRVNFFVNYTPRFLGSDLVGATYSASATTVNDRVGPARMKAVLTNKLNEIGLKYSFEINNASTRDAVTSEIQTALEPYAAYLDTTRTQIICDGSNNTDNSSQLNISVIVKPLLSIDSFVIDLTFTQ